jgi:Asp/Glu/hydantoin racemase
MKTPRIALIHATPVAIEPICDAFASSWPQARISNLLDDSLSADLAAEGRLSEQMIERFVTLARYCAGTGAGAILFTCSAFGLAIEAARAAVAIPVLKPNEAMFDEALEAGRTLGLLSTFPPSIPSMVRELEDEAARRAAPISIRTATVADAMSALQRGDAKRHDDLIAETSASSEFRGCDVLMLAQFSMARAAACLPRRSGQRVLTSPHSAVARLKRDLAQYP